MKPCVSVGSSSRRRRKEEERRKNEEARWWWCLMCGNAVGPVEEKGRVKKVRGEVIDELVKCACVHRYIYAGGGAA